jgi:hypothetical protein
MISISTEPFSASPEATPLAIQLVHGRPPWTKMLAAPRFCFMVLRLVYDHVMGEPMMAHDHLSVNQLASLACSNAILPKL